MRTLTRKSIGRKSKGKSLEGRKTYDKIAEGMKWRGNMEDLGEVRKRGGKYSYCQRLTSLLRTVSLAFFLALASEACLCVLEGDELIPLQRRYLAFYPTQNCMIW